MARHKRRESPLDNAIAAELLWEEVAPVFERARGHRDIDFVYFIGEADGIKIGFSRDPIGRLRGLQCGNPRSLVIERLLLGGSEIEALFHQRWDIFRQSRGEWFAPESRQNLFQVVDRIRKRQMELPIAEWDEARNCALVEGIHREHGVFDPRDQPRFLRAGA